MDCPKSLEEGHNKRYRIGLEHCSSRLVPRTAGETRRRELKNE